MDLLTHVNADAQLRSHLDGTGSEVRTPIMASPATVAAVPAAAGAGAVAAKAAGAVVGGGAVVGAAYAAYRAVVR
ncbi:hypothetical protein FGG90_13060 [Clavibacter tessellarius]|uniref:Uncharacterized protein n=1 Tax=Clavibacter tessellarius TaxID=31965 RepID=A0A225C8W6_9MICO|nr:hypothetical protein [Clavibacter michiganensis]MBT1636967.1 hypothetical protein [Clavibacter michiganensis]OQJ62170.1 hypothetical protein B5P24_03640 [Clavibacter michiganensis subsp. tessellarius]UKF34826.1 hypothetical protein FGG90_13060 [Clavibacter michiganensis subsp. tessellarius]